MNPPSSRGRAVLPPIPAVIVSIVSVQGGAAFAKELFPAIGTAGTAGLRIALSALMLLAVFRPAPGRLTSAQWRAVIPYGLVLGLMNLSFYAALDRIPLGLAVTLEFTGPLGLAVFGSRRRLDLLWALLAGVGVVLITPWSAREPVVDFTGALLALTAGGLWAAYIVFGRRASRVLPAGESVAMGMSIAALSVVPFVAGEDAPHRLTPVVLGEGLAVALLSSAVPYTLEMTALRVLPARVFGILMSLEPAAAALCGLLFLHEQLTPTQWLALLLVSTASAGTALTARPSSVEA
jgi:inner membrane transporter RhtA